MWPVTLCSVPPPQITTSIFISKRKQKNKTSSSDLHESFSELYVGGIVPYLQDHAWMSMFMQMLKGWSRMCEPGVVVSLCVYRRDLDHLWMFMVSVFLVFSRFPFQHCSTEWRRGKGQSEQLRKREGWQGRDREKEDWQKPRCNHCSGVAVSWVCPM